jgi:acetyl-CoA decarbonylase/synthase, CODH/ACS complex subunit delta
MELKGEEHMELVKEKWSSPVSVVSIGATVQEGGTRSHTITLGGMSALPFLSFEGDIPHRPVAAMEVLDTVPADFPPALRDVFGEALEDVGEWARRCVETFNAELISLRLLGTHPDEGDRGPEEARIAVRKVLKSVDVPLIILGSGVIEKDNIILPAVSDEARKEGCLIGTALLDNYRTIAEAALKDGHSVIAESPIDINIAKQVNILLNEMGLPLSRIVMYPTTGGLGYGIEYAYSIMERSRIAALSGDRVLAVPMICFAGAESWKVKEARAEHPPWGDVTKRGIAWEITTAHAYLMAGADILVVYHPDTLKVMNSAIEKLRGV